MIFRFPLMGAVALDGDTLSVTVDVGMRMSWHGHLRLTGINAPEVHSKNELEKQAGQAVQLAVRRWLFGHSSGNAMLVRSDDWDKFGRLLGDVEIDGAKEPSLVTHLLHQLRVVKPYHGEAKAPWTDDELRAVIARVMPAEPR